MKGVRKVHGLRYAAVRLNHCCYASSDCQKHGLSNASTEAELVANAIKECSEAHHAKLIGAPLQKLEKEIREAAIALFNMLPADAAGPLLASISAVAPQLF